MTFNNFIMNLCENNDTNTGFVKFILIDTAATQWSQKLKSFVITFFAGLSEPTCENFIFH